MSEITPEERAERVMMSNRYAGSMHEAIAELAQAIREAENAAYERAAGICEGMPIQIYRDEGIGPAGRSCKPSTFDDAAEAIRSLKSQSA